MAMSCPRVPLRLRLAVLGFFLLLPAACGVGGRRQEGTPLLVGGVVRPSRLAYEATSTAAAILPGGGRVELPSHVDLRLDGVIPPVKNQVWNDCVAWSLGYYVLAAVEARRMRTTGLFLDMDDPANWFAPDFLYSQRDTLDRRRHAIEQRALSGDPVPSAICFEADDDIGCMRPERALSELMLYGCCPWTWLCDEDAGPTYRACGDYTGVDRALRSRGPWQFATDGAGQFRPRCYVRFGSLDDLGQETVRRMQEWLHEQGTPIAIVVDMASGWVEFRGENETDVVIADACGQTHVERRPICLDAGGTDLGGQHMMTIIGYDRQFPTAAQYPHAAEGCEGSFLVINQWGEKWGDHGTMWIPCTELAKVWVGGYGLLAGGDLVVRPDSAAPLRDFVCVRDDEGKYLSVSADGNDVPVSLLTACEILALDDMRGGGGPATDCGDRLSPAEIAAWTAECQVGGDVPALHNHLTACRLALPPVGDVGGAVHGPAEIGGRDDSTGGIFDAADWYWFDVPQVGGGPWRIEIRPLPVAPAMALPDGFRLQITDASYGDVGVPLASGEGVGATVEAAGGRYFVKFSSTRQVEPELGTDGVPYQLEIKVILASSGEPAEPGVVLPACAAALPAPIALNAISLAGAQQTFVLPGIRAGNDVEIELADIVGIAPELELSVAVFQEFLFGYELHPVPGDCDLIGQVRLPESWFRSAQVQTVGAVGGTLRVSLAEGLGRGVYLGGRNSRGLSFDGFPDLTVLESARFSLFIGVRNRTGDAVDCVLHARVCGPDGQGPPPSLSPRGDVGNDLITLPLRESWEWNAYQRRQLEVQLTRFCGNPRIQLLDDAGTEITGAPGFAVEEVIARTGVIVTRVAVPESFPGNVWFRVVDADDPEAAPGTYALSLFRKATLAAWPLVQGVDVERDGNDTPSTAQVTSLSAAISAPLLGSVSYDDWYDFHRIVNDTGLPQHVKLRLSRLPGLCSFDPIVFGSHWPTTPPADPQAEVASEFLCHPCRVAVERTGQPDHDLIEFHLAPGEAQMVRLQFWEIALNFLYRNVSAAYRIEVEVMPP